MIATASLTLLAACGSSAGESTSTTSDGVTTLTVGSAPSISAVSLNLAAEPDGLMAKEKITIKQQTVQGGSQAIPLLLNGQLQIAVGDPTSIIVAASKGQPIVMVAQAVAIADDPTRDTSAVVAKPGGGIDSPGDLSGKTVAVVALNSLNTLIVSDLVDRDGGDSSTIKFVELPFAQISDAIANGRVDAGLVVEPFAAQATAAGLTRVSAAGSAVIPGLPQVAYMSTNTYVEKNPQVVDGFAKAMAAANKELSNDPAKVTDIALKTTQLTQEQLDTIILPTFTPTTIQVDALEKLIELMVKYGLVDEPIDVDKVMAPAALKYGS